MSRRGENIWKRKDGRWEARYIKSRTAGRAKYGFVYGKTYTEAKRKREKAVRLLYEENETHIQGSNVFDYVLDSFLEAKRRSVKESTYANYANHINKHIRPFFCQYQTADITTEVIERFASHLVRNGRLDHHGGLSNKTAKDILVLLKLILAYAEHLCVLDNPISCVDLPKVEQKTSILAAHEQASLEYHLLKNLNPCNLGILISLRLGLRIGEVCALKWENLDLAHRTIVIRSTIQRITDLDTLSEAKTKIIVGTPKSTYSERYIPIPSALLDQFYVLHKNSAPENYLLTGSTQYMEPRTFYRRYHAVLRECGLPQYTFHTLRHTFATNAAESGFDPKALSEILGHSSVKITLERYVHPTLEAKRIQMEKITQF